MTGNDAVTTNLEVPCHHFQGSINSKGNLYLCITWRNIWGSGGIDLLILNHSTRWRCVQLHALVTSVLLKQPTQYPLNKRFGWSPQLGWTFWSTKKKKLSSKPVIQLIALWVYQLCVTVSATMRQHAGNLIHKITQEFLQTKAEKICLYEGWNFNFGNTPLDWIQELLEWHANAAGRMAPSPTYIHNGSGPSRNGHTP